MMDEQGFKFEDITQEEVALKDFTAYNLVTLLYLDPEIDVGGKKFPNFIDYLKRVILQHKDVTTTPFEPSVKEHLNYSKF
jgi:hypothetical protein